MNTYSLKDRSPAGRVKEQENLGRKKESTPHPGTFVNISFDGDAYSFTSGPRPAQLRDCGRRSHGVTRTRQALEEGIKHAASSSAGRRKGRSPAPTRPSPTQRCPPCEGVSSPLHGDLRLGQSTRRTQNKQRKGGESVGTTGRPARAAALGPFPTRALGLQSRVGTAGSCRSHKAIVQPQGQGRGGGRGECGRRPRPKSSGIRGLFS